MKKLLCLVLVLIFAVAFTACGNDLPATADVETVETQETEATEPAGDSGASDTLDPLEGEHIIPNGEYVCYDRFSGEQVGGAWIEVHDSNSSQVVLSYVSSAGNWGPITIDIDGSQHGSTTVSGSYSNVQLDMTFNSSVITVDEIEGGGAMAYEFRHY